MHQLRQLFTRKYTEEEQSFFEFLRMNKIFNQLTDKELEKIKPLLYLRTYKENEAVFFVKDPSQAVYIVKTGKVSLTLDLTDGEEKLTSLRRGNIFGQNGIVENKHRNYNAIAKSEDTEIYVLPQQELLELFESDINLKAKVMTAFMSHYASYISKIFSTFRDNLGFFSINQVYNK